MHLDAIIPIAVLSALIIVLLGLALKRLGQPSLIGYLVAGIVIGPHGLALFSDTATMSRLGDFGVILLLFFVGMEISLPRLVAKWRVAVIGTLLQIAVNVLVAWVIGVTLGWSLPRSVLLGFVISLSSTAVVLKVLQDRGELDSETGQDVTGVLLVQDLALVPMLIVINVLGGSKPTMFDISAQAIGGAAIIGLLAWLVRRSPIKLPFARFLTQDSEQQVFGAFLLCFGFAALTGLLSLSTAVGAFVAGIVVTAARETSWVHENLQPFWVVFVALFFVSVGMLLDLDFMSANLPAILVLTVAAILINTIVNTLILRGLGLPFRRALYGGVLLSQIGEFSFVLAAVGLSAGMITGFTYQMTIAVIALTLLASPLLITTTRRLVGG
jgi:CPA2 family monovalent cation:H+ antiporter-2